MPAVKGVYTTHPITGADGIWLDVTGFGLVGLAKTDFPNQAGQNATQYQATITNLVQAQTGDRIKIAVAVQSLNPLLYTITVSEGTSKAIAV